MRLREAHPQPAQRTIRHKKMRVGVTLPSMKGKYVTKGFDIELGWLDSDQRITGSRPAALPLGYTPIKMGQVYIAYPLYIK